MNIKPFYFYWASRFDFKTKIILSTWLKPHLTQSICRIEFRNIARQF